MRPVKKVEEIKTKIKICGITKPEEAAYLNEYGADFAGFVLFYPKSPRNISIDRAERLFEDLDPHIRKVAVCVNVTIAQANAIADAGFDILQIHGSMFPEVAMNSRIPIWKAISEGSEGELNLCRRQPKVEGILLDAK